MGYKLTGMYIGQDKIRPSGGGGWQPGVNTLVYCELNGNINNTADTGYVMSSGGNSVTYSTVGNIQVGYFNSSNIYTSVANASELNGQLTYNIWLKSGANSQLGSALICIGIENTYEYRTLQTQINYNYRISGWFSDLDTPSNTLAVDTWQNVVATIDTVSGNRVIYINGVAVANDTASFNSFSENDITIGCNHTHSSSSSVTDTYFSKVIIENVAWTAQEVADYFNLTKANYGIS